MEEQREEEILRVEDAMRPMEGPVLDGGEGLDHALQHWGQTAHDVLLVRLSPSGWGSVAKTEIETMVKEGKDGMTLNSILAARQIPFLHPDHPLEMALRYVDRWPLIPVVSRADFRKLEGVVSHHDVLNRYRDFGEG